ncbi:MAG: hypothetical protein ACPGSD_01310 [Flavobacteriales bacterium]
MNVLNHTLNWYKGEAFEASITVGFGVLLIIFGILFWKLGTTAGLKALVIPIFIVGLIIAIPGIMNTINNEKALEIVGKLQIENKSEFIQKEIERVEGFQYLYTFTKYLALGLFSVSLLIFFFWDNKQAQAVAIVLIILGLSGLVIDYFSKERSEVYYQELLNEMQNE